MESRIGQVEMSLIWRSPHAVHCERRFFDRINFRAQITARLFDKRQYIIKVVGLRHIIILWFSAPVKVMNIGCTIAVSFIHIS